MSNFAPITADEWDTTDELWRMLHGALRSGRFTSRKQILYCYATCWHDRELLPAGYLPILAELEQLAEHPNLPPSSGERFFEEWSMAVDYSEENLPPFVRLMQELSARAFRVCSQRRQPGETYDETDDTSKYYIDTRVRYAVSGNLFSASPTDGRGSIERSAREADLLRELLGNPLHPVRFDPAWRTDTVLALAKSVYDSRGFGALPIMADALQDAGCHSEELLNHCRDTTKPHLRGCWALDLVLEK